MAFATSDQMKMSENRERGIFLFHCSLVFFRDKKRSFAAARASWLLLWWSGFGCESDDCWTEVFPSTGASLFGFKSEGLMLIFEGMEVSPWSSFFSREDSKAELVLPNAGSTSSKATLCWSWFEISTLPSFCVSGLLNLAWSFGFLPRASSAPYATFLSRLL